MATYYLNASTGSDSNTGGSGDPWLTFSYAHTQVVAGDILILSGDFTIGASDFGTGVEYIGYWTDPNDPASITLTSTAPWTSNPQRVLWENVSFVFDGVVRVALFNLYAQAVGCAFSRSSGSGDYIQQSSQAAFIDCTFTDIGLWAARTHCQRCTFINTSAYESTERLLLTECRFLNSYVNAESRNTTITNCSFHYTSTPTYVIKSLKWAACATNCAVSGAGAAQVVTTIDYAGRVRVWSNGSNSTTPVSLSPDSSIQLLSGDLFVDPVNGDWTPTSVLAAITGDDGLTPGAVQTYVSTKYHPLSF